MPPQNNTRRPSEVDWFPDWMPTSAEPSNTRNHVPMDYLLPDHRASTSESYRLSDASHGASSNGSKMGTVEEAEAGAEEDDGAIPSALPDDEWVIERNRDRAVK
jgi:hypothetical protein